MGTLETAISIAVGVDTGGEHTSTCASSGPVCNKRAAPASNAAISLTLTPSSSQERRSPTPPTPHPRPAVPIAPGIPHPHPPPAMPFALAHTHHIIFYQCFSTDISRQTTLASRGIGNPIQREARPFTSSLPCGSRTLAKLDRRLRFAKAQIVLSTAFETPSSRTLTVHVCVVSTSPTLSKFRENVRLSVQQKCHSVKPQWYQMMTLRKPRGIVALADPQRPCIS